MQGAIEGNISSSAFQVAVLKYGSLSRNPSVEYWTRDSSGGLEFNVLVLYYLYQL